MEEHTMVVNGTRWVYQSRRGNERIFTAGPTKSEIMVMVSYLTLSKHIFTKLIF